MSWSVIREATTEDRNRLEASAARFIQRHNLDMCETSRDIENWLEATEDRYRLRLWRACVRRALQEPQADGIAHGHVGYRAS